MICLFNMSKCHEFRNIKSMSYNEKTPSLTILFDVYSDHSISQEKNHCYEWYTGSAKFGVTCSSFFLQHFGNRFKDIVDRKKFFK